MTPRLAGVSSYIGNELAGVSSYIPERVQVCTMTPRAAGVSSSYIGGQAIGGFEYSLPECRSGSYEEECPAAGGWNLKHKDTC